MGTAQKQNIAIQHRYWNTHGTTQRTIISFEEWLEVGFQHQEEQGVTRTKIELSQDVMYYLEKDGKKKAKLESEFLADYKTFYLGQKPQDTPFEAGVLA